MVDSSLNSPPAQASLSAATLSCNPRLRYPHKSTRMKCLKRHHPRTKVSAARLEAWSSMTPHESHALLLRTPAIGACLLSSILLCLNSYVVPYFWPFTSFTFGHDLSSKSAAIEVADCLSLLYWCFLFFTHLEQGTSRKYKKNG